MSRRITDLPVVNIGTSKLHFLRGTAETWCGRTVAEGSCELVEVQIERRDPAVCRSCVSSARAWGYR